VKSNKIGCIVQARMGSTRLPGKSLMEINGKPVLGIVLERLNQCKKLDEIVVATTTNKKDLAIEEFCKQNSTTCFRGDEENVLKRFFECAKENSFGTIIRITADCPLIDPKTVDKAVEVFKQGKFDYVSNVALRSFPRGLDVEVLSFKALEKSFKRAKKGFDKEHVTHYIYSNPTEFKIGNVKAEKSLFRPELRFCVDTEQDFKLIKAILSHFNNLVPIEDAIKFIDQDPELKSLSNREEERYRKKTGEINQLTIRPVRLEDRQWILNLMNQESVRKNSFNQEKISKQENDAYWEKKLERKDFKAYAGIVGNEPVCVARIDKGKVSTMVDKKWKNKGIAFRVLSNIDLKGCIAEVKPENNTSKKLFKKLGFKEKKVEKMKTVFVKS